MITTLPKFNKTNLNYFLNGIISNKKLIIITSILQLLGFPMMSLTLVINTANQFDFDDSASVFFVLIGVLCAGAATLCGLIIAINNFNYLYKKSRVDMVFSLPIKAKNRFICDFFSGLLVYIVPYIIAALITIAIMLISGGLIEEVHDILKDGLLEFGLKGALMLLLIMTMIYTLAVLVMQCCGSFFETLMNIFLINGIIPGMILVISTMLLYSTYGVNVMYSSLPILCCTSPAGGITEFILLCIDEIDHVPNTPSFGKWLVLYIIVTVIFFAAALFLHTKRKAESVSKPYVFKLLYYVSLTSIISAICLIARVDISLIFPVIVCSAIVYMIFEVITNRGFKKFYKSAVKFVVTMFAILIVGLVSSATRGFGAEGRIPSVNSVKSVDVNYAGFYRMVSGYSYCDDALVFTDKKAIECVINAQRSALETYKSGSYYRGYFFDDMYGLRYADRDYDVDVDYPRYAFYITYNMKNGSHIHREYRLTQEQVLSLAVLDSTKEVGEYVEKYLFDDMQIPDIEQVNGKEKITTIYSLAFRAPSRNSTIRSQILTKEEAEEFARAYKQDYMEMSVEEMFKGNTICYLSNMNINNFPVKESFKRTLGLIEKYSIQIPSAIETESESAELYPPQGYASSGYADFTSSYDEYFVNTSLARSIYPDECNELIKYARDNYIDENKCYVMILDGRRFVIPYEYSDIAKRIYENTPVHYNLQNAAYLQLAEDLKANDDNYQIVTKYGFDDDGTGLVYNQLELLRSLLYSNFDKYSSFDAYYMAAYYSTNVDYISTDYNYITEKALWDLWQAYKKCYGYNSLEEYIESAKNSENTGDDISEEKLKSEWDLYYQSFSEFCK